MSYQGDYNEDYATLNFKFHSISTAAVPTTLTSGVLSVYKANDATQSTAGITLSADFDSVTGLNNVLIDLSSNAFYETGEDYQIVLTAGTVGGVSVIGSVVGTFSIENRVARTVSDIFGTQLVESYAVDGVAPTAAQALYLIQQILAERSVSGTTVTVKKLDGATTAATLTLNSSTAPSSQTRAT